MVEKVTVSLDAETFARVQAAARGCGMSVPAWMARVARRQAVRDAARRHEEWLAANPEIRKELDGFDRLADQFDGWSDLVDAA